VRPTPSGASALKNRKRKDKQAPGTEGSGAQQIAAHSNTASQQQRTSHDPYKLTHAHFTVLPSGQHPGSAHPQLQFLPVHSHPKSSQPQPTVAFVCMCSVTVALWAADFCNSAAFSSSSAWHVPSLAQPSSASARAHSSSKTARAKRAMARATFNSWQVCES